MTGSQLLFQPHTGHADQPEKDTVTINKIQAKDKVTENQRQKQPNKTTTPSTHELPHSKSVRLANLIGRRALIHCNLNGLAVSVLLDIGAQVSMIDRDWKSKYLPDTPVRPLSDIIGDEEELKVYAVNGDVRWLGFPYSQFDGDENPSLSITVPFLGETTAGFQCAGRDDTRPT